MAKLERLIEKARATVMAPEDIEEQRISFAYGNVHLANPRITREMLLAQAENMRRGSKTSEATEKG